MADGRAPKPKLWDQLNPLTLGGSNAATATNITRQTNPIHIQSSNRQALSDTVLINEASMRDGGVIPGSGDVNAITVSDDTRTTLKQPNFGEVVQVMAIDATVTGGSGSRVFNLYLYNGTNLCFWYYQSTTDTNVIFTADANWPDFPLFLTGPTVAGGNDGLYLQVVASGTFDSIALRCATVRVR